MLARLRVISLFTIILGLAACGAADTTDPTAGSSSAAPSHPGSAASPHILDGSRPGGTIGFYFLPPISKRLREYPGVFDAGFLPTVEVCELVGGSCGTVVARMTMDGTADGKITVDAKRERYGTKWKFDARALTPHSIYRIQVELDGQVIGYADAKAEDDHHGDDGDHHDGRGGEGHDRDSDLASPSTYSTDDDHDNDDDDSIAEHEEHDEDLIRLEGHGRLSIRFRLEESLNNVGLIGPPGGTVTSRDGLVTLIFPAGAVAKPTKIRIARMTWPSSSTSPGAYAIGPSGLQFGVPVTISMLVQPPLLSGAGAGALPLIVTHALPSDTSWTVLPSAAFDPITSRASALLTHFTTFAYVFLTPANVNCARIMAGSFGPASTLGCLPPSLVPRDTIFVTEGNSVFAGLLADVAAPFASPGGVLWVSGVFPSCEETFGQPLATCLPGLTSVSSRPDIAVRDKSGLVRGVKAGDAILTANFSSVAKGTSLVRVRKGVATTTHLVLLPGQCE